MRTTINKKHAIFLILLMSITFGTSLVEAQNNIAEFNVQMGGLLGSPVLTETKGIKPVVHQELLDILEQTKKQNTDELKNKFTQFPKEKKLETIAYCFKENKHISEALWKIIQEPSLRDKCLVPYLVEEMPKLKGQAMMLAARAAQMIPDVNFMEPLLNYAVESDYQEKYTGNIGRYTETIHMSAFEEAARAIYRITNRRIGSDNIRVGDDGKKSKEELIQQWRSAWPEVKQEMQKEKEEREREIRPVAHKELLDILEQSENTIERSKFADKFHNYKLNDRLETIVYALEQGLYPDSLSFMGMMQDKRLVPFIAQALKDPNDIKVLCAAQLAEINPYPKLLPFLMKYGLGNDFGKDYRYGEADYSVRYHSVFGWTSEAISNITNGKIGNTKYSSVRKEVPEEERQALIKQWRKIYEETLKQDFEPSKLVLPSTPAEPNKPVNKTPDNKIVP